MTICINSESRTLTRGIGARSLLQTFWNERRKVILLPRV